MDYNSTRSFTMTLAHRAVGDIRRGGFRQLRNYVDMCATLAKKQQQKDFFAYAQKALQRTDSCYYSLIHRLLDSVDMDYNSTRSFTMTLAHRAVGDIRRGGFRQLRNYVDMCATLAKKQQQKDFFAYAQKALQRTDSCYYSLIHRLLDSVDEDRICTVGVNMGFGGLIYGASELKKQADLEGQPIAWITAARCGDERLSELVPKAARHGSFVWLLDATDTDPAQVVLLAKANPQSAFGLLADPSALTEDCIKTLAACRNLVVMPLLQTPELTPEVCRAARRLKAQKMFYALTVLIDDETAGEVMQDDWLESMAQETLCCMCARKPGTSDETARKLRRSIVNGRLETGKPVLLLDWDGDVRYLNNRISEYMTFGSVLPEGSTFPLQLG